MEDKVAVVKPQLASKNLAECNYRIRLESREVVMESIESIESVELKGEGTMLAANPPHLGNKVGTG